MSRKVIVVLMSLFVLVSSFQVLTHVLAQADVCLPLVEQAMAQVGNNCDSLDRNTACYGFNRVNATFNDDAAAAGFTQPSDTSQIALFKSIETAPLDLPSNIWGIAVMRLQANLPSTLPGQSTVFMLIGDSQVENAVPPDDALITDTVVIVESSGSLTLRSAPSLTGTPIADFPAGSLFSADGISVDGDWLRVSQDDDWGWIERSAVNADDAIDTLALIEPGARTPMQAFVVSTSLSDLNCEDAPNMLVVQGPKDTLIDLNANGADIQLGSTIVLQTTGAPPFVLDSNAPDSEVSASAFSPDRAVVATGYADGSVRVWNATSGALISTAQASDGRITDLAYLPGTNTLAAASLDGHVTLWQDAQTDGRVFEQPTQALSLAFSGDGRTMAVGGADGSIYLWDPDTGEDVGMLTGHSGAVNGLAALGTRLASAGADGSVRLWDLTTRTEQITFEGHTGVVNAVSFQPDGTRLASGGSDGIRVWHLDAAGGAADVVDSGSVLDLEYTADGRRLLSVGSDENVQLWMTDALEQRSPIRGLATKATDIALSADGFFLVGGGEDGTSRLWRITPSEMTLAVIDGHAVVDGVTVPEGYITSIPLDESGRAVRGGWTTPRLVTLQELRPLSVVEHFPDTVVNYPPELPPELVAMAGTATQIAVVSGGGTSVAGFPTNTLALFATATGTTIVPTTVPATATPLPPTHTPVPPSVTFGNSMWNDLNGNGIKDPGEGALSGMPVELHVNPPFASTTTDANGAFTFTAPEGTYFLKYFPPPGFIFGAGSGINPDGTTNPFTLQNGVPPSIPSPALKQSNPFTDLNVFLETMVNGAHESFDGGVVEGQEFDAHIVIGNAGSEWATDVRAVINLPENALLLGSVGETGLYDPLTGAWDIGTLPAGESAALFITLRIRSGTVGEGVSLSAFLDTSTLDQTDTNSSNDSANVSFSVVPGSDLSVVKTVNDVFPAEGDTVVYTITAHNAGPQASPFVSVSEVFPAGLTFVSANPSSGYIEGGNWYFSDMAVDATETLTITFTVDAGTDGTTITNTAEIGGGNNDIFPDNNASGAAIEVGGAPPTEFADLSVHKTVSETDVQEGDLIHFTLEVTNTGPDDATGVVVTDHLPAGVTFDHAEGDGAYAAGSGLWTVGDLANGAAAFIDLFVRVNNGTGGMTIENTAAATDLDQGDNNPSNDASEASFSVQLPVQTADIVISKAASVDEAAIGDQFTFTVAVTNDGPDNATAVVISDTLPSSVTYVSHVASAGTFTPGSGLWNVGSLPVGEIETLTITVTVNANAATTAVFNSAHVQSLTEEDPNTLNDSASAFVDVATLDIALEKEVDNAKPEEGATVEFTVRVTNNGPLGATGVEVTDLLPDGLTLVDSSSSAGSYNETTGVWTVGALALNAEQTLTISATVDAGTGGKTLVNMAEVTAVDQRDAESFNDFAFAFVKVQNDSADLRLSKFVSGDEFPVVGEIVTFRLSVSNGGPQTATNVQVRDLLPAGLVYLSHTADQGSYNSSTGVWVVGTVEETDFLSLNIRARVAPGTQGLVLTNSAEITGASLPDPDESNNSDSASVTVQNPGDSADLSLEKTTFDVNPNEGDTVSFTITLRNNGPNVATNVQVRDLLPPGLTLEGGFGGGGFYDEETGIWTVSQPLANGDSVQLFIGATVDGGTSGRSITNSAEIIDADQDDPNPGNNDDSVTLSVQDSQLLADLSVRKTSDREGETVEVGETVRFSVQVDNDGPDNALGVQISDLLPTGLAFNEVFVSQGSYNPATGVWNVGTISADSSAQLDISASPAAGTQNTTVTNTASVLHSDQPDPDSSDNSASADVEVGATVPQDVNLRLSMNADFSADTGETIETSISVFNEGPDNATGVQVTAELPAGLEYVSQSGDGSYNPETGVWNIGALESFRGAFVTITAQVTAPSGSTLTSTASITHVDQTEGDPSDDADSATTTIGSDLALIMVPSLTTVDEGQVFAYSMTVTNNGVGTISDLRIIDVLPSTLTFVSFSGSGSYDPATGRITLFTGLDSGESLTVGLNVFANAGTAGTTILNSATVSAIGLEDADTSDNSASASVDVETAATTADLSITKTASDYGPTPGVEFNFVITVSNNGPDSATNVVVNDLLPAGLTYVFGFVSGGSYEPTSGVWTIPLLANGASETLTIYARVNDATPHGTTITNTATVSAAQDDPETGNNSASAVLIVAVTDLSVTKTVNNPTPNEGAQVQYVITVENLGQGNATNVVVTDLLPEGVTFLSASTSFYNPLTGVWRAGTINAGNSASLFINATVSGGTSGSEVTNTATLTSLDQDDTDESNNVGSATFTGGTAATAPADISLSKTVNSATTAEGEQVTYTITVTNGGAGTSTSAVATGLVVRDLLPAGLVYESSSVTRGVYDPASGVWNVGALNNSGSATLTLRALVDSGTFGTTITNTAELIGADQPDPDSTPNNGAGGEDDQSAADVSVDDAPTSVDLVISKGTSTFNASVGETVTFTIQTHNFTASGATGVQVTEFLPDDLTLVSAVASRGSYDAASGVWNIGVLGPNSYVELVLQTTVNDTDATEITNTASITAMDQTDPDPSTNSSEVTINVDRGDLSLGVSAFPLQATVGSEVGITVILTNNGPSTLSSAVISNPIPAGTTLVSADPSEGTYNPSTGLWRVNFLSEGDNAFLDLVVRVNDGTTSFTDTATLNSSDPIDTVTGNNSASVAVSVVEAGGLANADVALNLEANRTEQVAGSQVTLVISASNHGADAATNVQISVALPPGLSYISHSGDGAYDAQTGIWTLATLGDGTTARLNLVVAVDSDLEATALTNRVQVIALDQNDPVLSNNVGMLTITVTTLDEPTEEPTAEVTSEPTADVTGTPTVEVTSEPTAETPTDTPTEEATVAASDEPTEAPDEPTQAATEAPTAAATATYTPTAIPTAIPTAAPTEAPPPEATESAAAKRPASGIFALASVGLLLSVPVVARRKRK